jgi:tetratricopeptide (TPR) repeat protein
MERTAGAASDSIESAKQAFRAGRVQESIAQFESAIRQTDQAEAHYGLGVVWLELGDLDAAEASLGDALARDPDHADATYQLGRIAERRGDTARARAMYERVLGWAPQHAGARDALQRVATGTPAAAQPLAQPAGPPASPRHIRDEAVIGVVSGLQQRLELDQNRPLTAYQANIAKQSVAIWTFRLERPGERPASVELRGRAITGLLRDGDWVAVPARWRKGGLRVDRIENLETGELVQVQRPGAAARVVMALTIVAVLLVLAFIAAIWIILGSDLLNGHGH